MRKSTNRRLWSRSIPIWIVALAFVFGTSAWAAHHGEQMKAAKKWVDEEFQPSTLSKAEQMKEMEWFIKAAKPFKGMNIKVVSETIPTHEYEAKVLAKAFEEITGIKVSFDLIQEGDVIEKLQSQWASGENLYDAYINDSDLIGTHFRYGHVVPLSDFMAGEGKDVTLPTLDVDDFMGKSFTTGPDGKLYQLPDQQFANLYWFRYDWFNREDFKKNSRDLRLRTGRAGQLVGLRGHCRILRRACQEIDGKAIYGHNDYGKKAPDLGWRFTDAWLSMAGAGDKGIPNGKPVDEWGIRVEGCRPVGASVERGGAPTARPPSTPCANTWSGCEIRPAGRPGHGFLHLPAGSGQRHVAQQIFWYTAFTSDMVKPGPTVNADGTPKWRMAPSPHGPYWEEGMKLGYQDCGLDADEEHAAGAPQGRLALRPVLRGQDHLPEKDPCGPDAHPRQRYPARVLHRAGTQARRAGGVLPQPGARRLDTHRVPTCPTIPSWPSCGGRTSARRFPAR
jgi:glycerol transport system substrate-binding protein